MAYSRITGTGSYLPAKVLTNLDFEKMVETTGQWIEERTGIKQRHIADSSETTCDLAEQAAREAIKAANIRPEQIDLIILATTTPDRIFPSTACLLQQRLGLTHACPAFDIQAVCTGFIYAMSIADQFIRTGHSRCVLVIGAETLSRIIDWKDRNTCVLFGDGAGAVILQASATQGIYSSHLHADGQYEHLLTVPGGVSQGYEALTRGELYLQMKGSEVFKKAVNALGDLVDETLQANQISQDQITWLVPHQANIRIIAATAKRLNLSMDQVVVTVDRHGNTSAASVPLALDTAVKDGRIKTGDLLLLEAFGGGFTWGSLLVKF